MRVYNDLEIKSLMRKCLPVSTWREDARGKRWEREID